GGSLLTLLARLGLVSERDHAETCASVLELPLANAKALPELPPELPADTASLSLKFMKQFHVVPIGESGDALEVLVADPQDAYALDAIHLATGREVHPQVALRSEIDDLV